MKIANVIVLSSVTQLDRVFDYIIPDHLKPRIEVGSRVIVPFGTKNRNIEGFVVGLKDSSEIDSDRLKNINKLVDDMVIFDEKNMKLAKWMSNRYVCSLSMVMNLMVPSGMKLSKTVEGEFRKKIINETSIKYVSIIADEEKLQLYIQENSKRAKKKIQVIKFIMGEKEVNYQLIKRNFGDSVTSILNRLKEDNIIQIKNVETYKAVYDEENYRKTADKQLTDEQQKAFNAIITSIKKSESKTFLLNGVTGSGKTEVYLQVIRNVIENGKQCIVLVPEISLTPQIIERFVSRFGNSVAVLHSKLSDRERLDQWKLINKSMVKIVVGARSAIFAPCRNLGLVIVDEEHETSYKSQTTPKYDAVEVAKVICYINKCTLILGTATPSIENYNETRLGNIELLKMDKRVDNKLMPEVDIIDMRDELLNGNLSLFSRRLIDEIKTNLLSRQQTIIFLNKRGYFTFVSCRACGYVIKCPNCDVAMKYHFKDNRLKCHFCGYETENPSKCPQCGKGFIKYFGCGTERVESEIKRIFPQASVIRMDADTTRKKGMHEFILKKFINEKINILIGTQMIAKGLDIPNVTLVGVVTADTILNIDDFRSAEKTFQMMEQVSGRAGRGNAPGRVIIQTYAPEHYSLKYVKAHDYEGFFNQELSVRRIMQYPPFSKIISILVSGEDENEVKSAAYNINDIIKNDLGNFSIILGPAECDVAKINKKYRWRIIIKTKKINQTLIVLNRLRYDIIKNSLFNKVIVDIDVNVKDFI